MSHAALVNELRATAGQVERGQVDWDDVANLATRAQIEAKAASSADRAVIAAGLAELEGAIKSAMDHLADELRSAGHARGAIQAYGSLRSHTRAQRVRTRA
ncbi:MAG: hypothetical protein ABMA64_00650 [Myxococcota bacterium]